MAARTLPGIGLKGFPDKGEDDWHLWADPNWRTISALLQARVTSLVTSLPAMPTNGDMHILTEGDNANAIILRDASVWIYLQAQAGFRVYVSELETFHTFNGTAWVPELADFSASSQAPEITLRKRGSVEGVNEPVALGADVGALAYEGWTGSMWRTGARVVARTRELWSNVSNGSMLVWQVIANGTTELVDRMYLTPDALLPADTDGEVDIGAAQNRWGHLYANGVSLMLQPNDEPQEDEEVRFSSNGDNEITIFKRGSDGILRSVTLQLSE